MGNPDDKDPGKKSRPARDGVSHDARGNAVWQWAVDSGRHLMESTSLLLKRLEVPGLKLEEDASAQEKRSAAKPEPSAGPAPRQRGLRPLRPQARRADRCSAPAGDDYETSCSTTASSVVVAAPVSAGLKGSR